jgi:4'-phosphopantetheinyl transferase EntD
VPDIGRALDNEVRSLCPPAVVGGARRITRSDLDRLVGAENAEVAHAVVERRAEYASGRALLRSLLNIDAEISRDPSGRPSFPAGSTGTLAHDDEFVVGAVGPTAAIRGIGIDIERRRELDAGMTRIIVGRRDSVPDTITAFVAKEAVYKAWSNVGGDMLDHHDVSVVVDDASFRAEVNGGWPVIGQLRYQADRVIALVVVSAD